MPLLLPFPHPSSTSLLTFYASHLTLHLTLISAWTASRDLSSLTTREIEAYVSSPAKKSGDLLTAYKIARDPTEWQRQRDEAQAEYDNLQAQAAQYVDELQSGDEEESGAKKSKKRKSESGKSATADKKSKKAKVDPLTKSRVSPTLSIRSFRTSPRPNLLANPANHLV